MTDKERRLGLENAKLAMKIHRQRQRLRLLLGPTQTAFDEVNILVQDARRENAILKDRNTKLVTENRALRLLVLHQDRQ